MAPTTRRGEARGPGGAPRTRAGALPPRPRGFTFFLLLLMVAITSVLLLAAARTWTQDSRRQKEAELLFRGEQYRAALVAYAAQPPRVLPMAFSDLLEDRRGAVVLHHLRTLYPDPITGAPTFEPVRDAGGAIVGVRSGSDRWSLAIDRPRRYSDIVFGVGVPVAPSPPASTPVAP